MPAHRQGQLAPRRPAGKFVSGAELPAVEFHPEAAASRARHAGSATQRQVGGPAPRSVGRPQCGELLGYRGHVRHADFILHRLGAVLQNDVELLVPGSQV